MDANDECLNQAEDRDQFEDSDGCLDPDNDMDSILGFEWDQCPNEPEDFDGDQDEDGCPDLYKNIVVTDKKIELMTRFILKPRRVESFQSLSIYQRGCGRDTEQWTWRTD